MICSREPSPSRSRLLSGRYAVVRMRSRSTWRSRSNRPGAASADRSQDQRSTGAWRLEFFISVALALATLLVYCPSFDFPFINFDDQDYVSENPHVQAGLTAASVRWAFTTFNYGNWHPLTWLSLQLDAALYGGLNAGGFHLTNVLLHTA